MNDEFLELADLIKNKFQEFYKLFSATYQQRTYFALNEYTEYTTFSENFSNLYSFANSLNKLLTDTTFRLAGLDDVYDQIVRNYEKEKAYGSLFITYIESFSLIVYI